MWLAGVVVDACFGAELTFKGYFVPLFLSFMCYVAATMILDISYLFERRIRWLSAMFMWLTAISFPVHEAGKPALAVFLLAVIVYKLFACRSGEGVHYGLYSVFTVIGCASLLFPHFLLLLPVFIVYGLVAMMPGVRGLLAMLLGLCVPCLLVTGIDYIFPGVVPDVLVCGGMDLLKHLSFEMPDVLQAVLLLLQFVVLLSFTVMFVKSSVPGKRYLRRRLVLLIYLNISLFLMSLLYNEEFVLFYMMSLPSVAVMMAYVFSMKVSKPMNWFFIAMNLLWLALFPLSLCLRHL